MRQQLSVNSKVNESTNKNVLKEEYIDQLEEWSSLKCSDVLFDSNVDDWSIKTSVLNKRIIGKKQLTFIIEDEDNEIFGYYLNTQIIEEYKKRQKVDNKSFEFNLQSKDNRLSKPMKFEIINLNYGIRLHYVTDEILITLGDIHLMKQNKKNKNYCYEYIHRYNYHEIENALCGKTFLKFHPKRILVIQMQ